MTLKKPDIKWKAIILFPSFFLLNQFLLELPGQIPALRIFDGNWNWSGKIYALTGSILFYMLFKKVFVKNDFFTFKQKDDSLKYTLPVTIIVILVTVGSFYFLVKKSE